MRSTRAVFLLVPAALCTAPAVALTVAMGGSTPYTNELITYALPVLVGYPVAVLLCLRARRASRTRGWAWTLAALGVALAVAVSVPPVAAVADLYHQEWLISRPGDRGYR